MLSMDEERHKTEKPPLVRKYGEISRNAEDTPPTIRFCLQLKGVWRASCMFLDLRERDLMN